MALRRDHESGRVRLSAPALLFLEVLNAAAWRWRWSPPDVLALAERLVELGISVEEPALDAVASWVSRGLTAYDAAYVAVAEQLGVKLVTADAEIVRVGAEVALSLASYGDA